MVCTGLTAVLLLWTYGKLALDTHARNDAAIHLRLSHNIYIYDNDIHI